MFNVCSSRHSGSLSASDRCAAAALAVIMVVGSAAPVLAQKVETGDPDAVAQGQALAGADSGGAGAAVGEVPLQKVPFQTPGAASAPLDPSDFYGNWQQWKADLKKKTGTSFDLYINPSDQVILSGSGKGNNRGTLWYNLHIGQRRLMQPDLFRKVLLSSWRKRHRCKKDPS